MVVHGVRRPLPRPLVAALRRRHRSALAGGSRPAGRRERPHAPAGVRGGVADGRDHRLGLPERQRFGRRGPDGSPRLRSSGLCFLLGIAPPGIVRVLWRTREQQRLQEAIRGLMTLATTRERGRRARARAGRCAGRRRCRRGPRCARRAARRARPRRRDAHLGGGRRAARAPGQPGGADDRGHRRHLPRLDVPLRALLRRQRAARAADRRRDDRRRARPGAALRAGARVAARASSARTR